MKLSIILEEDPKTVAVESTRAFWDNLSQESRDALDHLVDHLIAAGGGPGQVLYQVQVVPFPEIVPGSLVAVPAPEVIPVVIVPVAELYSTSVFRLEVKPDHGEIFAVEVPGPLLRSLVQYGRTVPDRIKHDTDASRVFTPYGPLLIWGRDTGSLYIGKPSESVVVEFVPVSMRGAPPPENWHTMENVPTDRPVELMFSSGVSHVCELHDGGGGWIRTTDKKAVRDVPMAWRYASPEERAPRGWRTMETAPRDGTVIQLNFDDVEPFTGFWDPRYNGWSRYDNGDFIEEEPKCWKPFEDGRCVVRTEYGGGWRSMETAPSYTPVDLLFDGGHYVYRREDHTANGAWVRIADGAVIKGLPQGWRPVSEREQEERGQGEPVVIVAQMEDEPFWSVLPQGQTPEEKEVAYIRRDVALTLYRQVKTASRNLNDGRQAFCKSVLQNALRRFEEEYRKPEAGS